MSSEYEIERRCSHEKKRGIVHLSPTQLVWTPDSAADGVEVRVPFTSIRQFQVSKEGSAKKAMIRLTCNDRSNPITLDFAKDFTDRDAIRDVLNRLQSPSATPAATAEAGTGGARTTPPPPSAKPVGAEERAWREKLLTRREVRRLHARVVRGGAASDAIFWAALKFRYKPNGEPRARAELEAAETDVVERQRGVPSDAYTAGESCAMDTSTWEGAVPSPAQRHLVFMEHPAVARALADKVPGVMSEEKFWEHFLASSMATKKRRGYAGRVSKTDAVRAAEADAVFASFQAYEREVWEREEGERARMLDRGIDLDRFDDHRTAHVTEGHVVGGDAPREMKRRKVGLPASGSLALMRQVNRHGKLIVDDTGGGGPAWVAEAEGRGRPLQDLLGEAETSFVKLDVTVRTAGATAVGAKGLQGGGRTELAEAVEVFARAFETWRPDVTRFAEAVSGSSETLRKLLATMRP